MNARPNLLLLISVAALFLSGCGATPPAEREQSAPVANNSAPAIQIFEVKGLVKELHPEKLTAKIKHEEIPDYMPAMTMNFTVRNAQELVGLAPEDAIAFRLNVSEDEHWIDQVRKAAPAETGTPLTAPENWRRVRDVEPLKIGEPMPNYDFTNELGQAMSLKDLQGQAFAFTFIFTRCPLPDFCPRMSSRFQETQQALLARPDAPKNWRLFSITMDPEFDSPAVLKAYAARYKYDPASWSYLTAPLIDITAIGEQFGLEFYKPDGSIAHNLRTVVVDATGKVQNIITGNTWKSEELVNYLVAAAAAKPSTAAPPKN